MNSKIFSCIDTIPEESKIIIIENSGDLKLKQKIEAYRSNIDCFDESKQRLCCGK